MATPYDVVVIGAGLGGLTAAALLAKAGRKTLLIERNTSVGGAATTYKVGDLVVEASLHETADPRHPADPKHQILGRIGVRDAVQWVSTGALYEVRGGPLEGPFVLPDGFAEARARLTERFPDARDGIAAILGDMEHLDAGLGAIGAGWGMLRHPGQALGALVDLAPAVRDWRLSLSEAFDRAFGANEAVKCALAANLAYYHDDPDTLWWIAFAVAQGGFLGGGGCYVHGGSQRLSNAIARAFRAAGGELLLRRTATEIRPGGDGEPLTVAFVDRAGERTEVLAKAVACNAAPAVLAELLPQAARDTLDAVYAARPLSTSLFSLSLGLSCRPAELGVRGYSTFLLPPWMTRLTDYRVGASLLAKDPEGRVPLMTLVDYSAIESGLGGEPYPVSIVGTDRVENWAGLDGADYAERRRRWQDAIVATLEANFPGFARAIVASTFNTARSIRGYLNAPAGAVYGFAPTPPPGPIWKGFERSPVTPVPGLYLASAYTGMGGFSGAIQGGGAAADRILADT